MKTYDVYIHITAWDAIEADSVEKVKEIAYDRLEEYVFARGTEVEIEVELQDGSEDLR